MRRPAGLVAAAVLVALAACRSSEPTEAHEDTQTEIDRVEWLAKASRVLRSGDGLGPRDDVSALVAMPREAVVDLWMKDARFADSVLAFTLFYLGRSVEQLRLPGTPNRPLVYAPMAEAWPQAMAAARAAASGGDFFELYAAHPPALRRWNESMLPAPLPAEVIAALDAAIARTKTERAQGCAAFVAVIPDAVRALTKRGLPAGAGIAAWVDRNPAYETVDCLDTASTVADVQQRMTRVRAAMADLFTWLEASPVRTGVAESLRDTVPLPATPRDLPPLLAPLTRTGFWDWLPVSSTNLQRKRAAYVLETYFCDDLTPLSTTALAPGSGGTKDIHGANPSCQACHYRLDPIGALFRNIGNTGDADATQISFSDSVTLTGPSLDAYLSHWRGADGAVRAGYWVLGNGGVPRREERWTDADGDRLDGLWSYLPRSPVVKSCLVRRLAEYVLGPGQVYDAEWLAEIASTLQPGPDSGARFREVVKRLVLGKTFSVHNPRAGTCYDTPSAAAPGRAPCAIAHVVAKHCAGCHASTSGPGRLDLTRWSEVSPGTFSWPHLDSAGKQLAPRATFERIRDRLVDPDPERRMPLLRQLPEGDLATFHTWLETEIR